MRQSLVFPWPAPPRRGPLLLAALLAGSALCPALALAQAPSPPQAAPASRPTPPAPTPAHADEEDEDDAPSSQVVVTAQRRAEPGAVVGDVKPELQLRPADIQAYGVSTITELLDELAPQTRSGRGRGGEAPVVLLNGRRISGFNEISSIPTEAIARVDILPEEVALKYGYSADQRVVNIVLRRYFRAVTGEGSAGAATGGGRATGQAELDVTHIRGDNRLNFDVRYQQSSALTENERDLTPLTSDQLFTRQGAVSAGLAGGEIDPALSALAGRTVTSAGIPAAAGARPLTLADFAATAGQPGDPDIGRYRTLAPATRQVRANAVLSRALFAGISGTANATLTANHSESLQGLPSLSLLIPADDPFSPFGSDVRVSRYLEALPPLRQTVDGWSSHLGSALNRDVGKWRLSLTGAYDHADTRTVTDTGLDPRPLQALLAAGSPSFDPFAPLPLALAVLRPQNSARVDTDTANLQLLGNGPLLNVPAGQLYASVKLGDAQSWLDSLSSRAGVDRALSVSRNILNAQVNLDLPIASRRTHVLEPLGNLSLNANAAVNRVSDFGALTSFGYGLTWSPLANVNLIASHTHDEAAPSTQQLGAPVVLTPGARILDFTTGRTVEVTRLDGGNPGLTGDTRNVLKLGLNVTPIPTKDFTVSANFVQSRIRNPIATFPAATPEIEAAFPDRFVRDASGQLVQVDFRPVNFARQDRRELRWGFNYSRPIGPQPTRRPGGGFGGGFGGGAGGTPPPGGWRRAREAGAQGSGAAPRDGDAAAAAPPGGERPADAPGQGAPGAREGAGPGGGRDGAGPGGRFGGPGGGFGGRGRGGFGGGGFGGGGGRLQLALYHTLVLEDRILVRPGGPVFDPLHGSAAGSGGGESRHALEAQAGYLLNGFGARLSANWRSGTLLRGTSAATQGAPTGDLRFSPLTTVNARLFANFGGMRTLVQRRPWLRGSRLTVSIDNLFDQRPRVRDALGQTPLSYQPAYLDPVGRTVRVSFRKLFF